MLEDVRKVLEFQVSLVAQGASLPSAALTSSIQRCKDHVKPLAKIVEDYGATTQIQAQKVKYWDMVRLSFKRKNVEDFERRISQEIGYMMAALASNHTLIRQVLDNRSITTSRNYLTKVYQCGKQGKMKMMFFLRLTSLPCN